MSIAFDVAGVARELGTIVSSWEHVAAAPPRATEIASIGMPSPTARPLRPTSHGVVACVR
jgi:hypothetical protein